MCCFSDSLLASLFIQHMLILKRTETILMKQHGNFKEKLFLTVHAEWIELYFSAELLQLGIPEDFYFFFFCSLQYLDRVCEHTGNLNHVVPKSLPQASWSPGHRTFVKHWWNDKFMKCLSFTKGSSSGPIIFSGCWGRLWWGHFETQAHWTSLCVSSNTKAMCILCKRKVIACCNL